MTRNNNSQQNPLTPNHSPDLYRPNIGLAIFNQKGRVFWAQRLGEKGTYAWQMPQGGIDKGESPEQAALRELQEETGITPIMVTPLGTLDKWLYYDFPPEVLKQKKSKSWLGQKQKWFAFSFLGQDQDICLETEQPEFSEWIWAGLETLPPRVIPWKQAVYTEVVKHFSGFAHTGN